MVREKKLSDTEVGNLAHYFVFENKYLVTVTEQTAVILNDTMFYRFKKLAVDSGVETSYGARTENRGKR